MAKKNVARRGKMPHPRKRKTHIPEVRLPAALVGRKVAEKAGKKMEEPLHGPPFAFRRKKRSCES
jgi:hypothetical protein